LKPQCSEWNCRLSPSCLGNQRSLIPDGQPVIVELAVMDAKGTEKRDGELRE
jgi:hypothetical protein